MTNLCRGVDNPPALSRFDITVERTLAELAPQSDCATAFVVAVADFAWAKTGIRQHDSDATTGRATARATGHAFPTARLVPSGVGCGREVAFIGSSLPENLSGVLKAKGHPPGASGVAKCVELFQELCGEAVNHVGGARIALALHIEGPTAGPVVTILEGPGTNGG